jgi:hypothetical protein
MVACHSPSSPQALRSTTCRLGLHRRAESLLEDGDVGRQRTERPQCRHQNCRPGRQGRSRRPRALAAKRRSAGVRRCDRRDQSATAPPSRSSAYKDAPRSLLQRSGQENRRLRAWNPDPTPVSINRIGQMLVDATKSASTAHPSPSSEPQSGAGPLDQSRRGHGDARRSPTSLEGHRGGRRHETTQKTRGPDAGHEDQLGELQIKDCEDRPRTTSSPAIKATDPDKQADLVDGPADSFRRSATLCRCTDELMQNLAQSTSVVKDTCGRRP